MNEYGLDREPGPGADPDSEGKPKIGSRSTVHVREAAKKLFFFSCPAIRIRDVLTYYRRGSG